MLASFQDYEAAGCCDCRGKAEHTSNTTTQMTTTTDDLFKNAMVRVLSKPDLRLEWRRRAWNRLVLCCPENKSTEFRL